MIIGSKIHHKEQCESSLKWARDILDETPDGTVLICDDITNAKGRMGRVWNTFDGQALLTIILKPNLDIKKLHHLNMALTLGCLSALERYGVGLKWPNDFVINGKKLGGILIELVWSGSNLKGIIVGCGLNINNNLSPELPNAISLHQVTGKKEDLNQIIEFVLNGMDKMYSKWLSEGLEAIYMAWKSKQVYQNDVIKIFAKTGQETEGVVIDYLRNGDLVLDVDGKRQQISFDIVELVWGK